MSSHAPRSALALTRLRAFMCRVVFFSVVADEDMGLYRDLSEGSLTDLLKEVWASDGLSLWCR